MLPPATIPSGPPMIPSAPPSSAPRPAPQSFDSTYFAFPSGLTCRTATFPTLSGNAPPTEPPPREPPSGVEKLAATILRVPSAMSAPFASVQRCQDDNHAMDFGVSSQRSRRRREEGQMVEEARLERLDEGLT